MESVGIMIKQLKKILNKNEIRRLYFLTFFSIIVSFGEVFGLSMVVPFISIASNKNSLYSNKYLSFFYEVFNFNSYKQFLIVMGIFLIIVFLIKNILNLIFNYLLISFSLKNYYRITSSLMKKYLEYTYQYFIKENSNTLSKNILTECSYVVMVLQSLLLLLGECIVVFTVYIVMLIVNFKITLFVTLFLGFNILIIKLLIINKVKVWGRTRAKAIDDYYKIIGSTFGNYKFIKLLSKYEEVNIDFQKACNNYIKVDKKFQGSQPISKYILETLGFSIVIFLIIASIIIHDEKGLIKIMPTITVFFIGLYKTLPSINRIVNYYQNVVFYNQSLNIIVKELQKPSEALGNEKIYFTHNIKLDKLIFGYEENKEILKEVSLEIKKGDKVAFIGESGSGKTTLVDSIIGLYVARKGSIYIDNTLLSYKNLKSWRSSIGYIPQEVYLFDGTVEDNVVFGRKYNYENLESALKKAQIWDFLQEKKGIKTIVGDKGIMLSGGQKQRIAIARALYNNPEVLVLDEATSALDNETEREIMKEIYEVSENKTLIIVAHRLTTLESCNKIFILDKGKIVREVNSIKQLSKDK